VDLGDLQMGVDPRVHRDEIAVMVEPVEIRAQVGKRQTG